MVDLASPPIRNLVVWRARATVNSVAARDIVVHPPAENQAAAGCNREAMDDDALTSPAPTRSADPANAAADAGAEGNERLTAMTGSVLLVLLLVECYTILRIGRLLTLHVFLGMLLLGPVTLKAGSVLYRFARYYTGSGPYRRKGPPALLLRFIGPVIMLLTACVFGSGIMLAVTGPSYSGGVSEWLTIHRISFIAWAFFITIHVLAHVWRLPRLLAAEARGTAPEGQTGPARRAMQVLGGRGPRLALLLASLLAGLVIALLTVHLAGNWEPNFG
jgi:hypothetical protein